VERQAGRRVTFAGKEEFIAWYQSYVKKQEKVERATKKSPEADYPDGSRAYQECRIASAYTKDEYFDLVAID
jgi:hypothetical protein